MLPKKITPGIRRLKYLLPPAVAMLLGGCVVDNIKESVRGAIPFLPPPKYVTVNGRKLTRSEVQYYQRIRDLSLATKINPKDAVALQSLGELFQKRGGYQLAKRFYQDALDIDPNLSEARQNLGYIYYLEKRYFSATEELEKARDLSPDDAKIRMRLGLIRAAQGKPNEAFKEYDEAISLDAEFIPAYLEKARLQFSQKNYQAAEETCRAAIKKVPKEYASNKAKENRGGGIFGDILPSYRSDQDDPTPTYKQEAAYNLALCLRAQGRTGEALAALHSAENIEVAELDVGLLKARLEDDGGDTGSAINQLEKLRKDFSKNAEIPKLMSQFEEKRGRSAEATKLRLEAASLDHSDKALQEEAAKRAETDNDRIQAIAIYERLVRIDPESIAYRIKLADYYEEAGIKRKAALEYQEIINREQDNMAVRRKAAVLYSEIPGFQGRAVLQLKRVLEATPDDQDANRRLGELYLQSKNYLEAEKHIRKSLDIAARTPGSDPKRTAEDRQNLATLFVGQNRFDDAVEEYRKALALDPTLLVAKLNLSKVLLGLNRREEAVEPLTEYLKAKPADEEARLILAGTLRELGRKEDSIAQYEEIRKLHPGDPEASMKIAELRASLGDKPGALGIYETVIERYTGNAEALRAAAKMYSVQDGMRLRAIYCWERLITVTGGDKEAQNKLAELYLQIGDEKAAAALYEDAGRAGDSDAYNKAAELRLKRNEEKEAAADLRQIIASAPKENAARKSLAAILRKSTNADEKQEALQLYEDLVAADSTDALSRLSFANLLTDSGQLNRAQEQYQVLLRANANNIGALCGMGVVRRRQTKYNESAEFYRKVLTIDPQSKAALYNLMVLYEDFLKDPVKADEYRTRYKVIGGGT